MFKKIRCYQLCTSNFRHVLLLGYAVVLVSIVITAGVTGGSEAGEKIRSVVSEIPMFDKLGHFLLFGILAFMVHWSQSGRVKSLRRWVLITLVVAVIVLAEELTQIWIPRRSFDPGDMVADLAGIFTFSVFAYFFRQRIVRS